MPAPASHARHRNGTDGPALTLLAYRRRSSGACAPPAERMERQRPNWCLSRPARIKIWEHRGFGEDPVYPDALFPPGNPNLPGKRDAG
jgi:hypothetical protein